MNPGAKDTMEQHYQPGATSASWGYPTGAPVGYAMPYEPSATQRGLPHTSNPARLHYSQKHKGIRTSRSYREHPHRHNLIGLLSSPFVRKSDLELKWHDVNSGDVLSTTWTASTSLVLIGQGTGEALRIGSKLS